MPVRSGWGSPYVPLHGGVVTAAVTTGQRANRPDRRDIGTRKPALSRGPSAALKCSLVHLLCLVNARVRRRRMLELGEAPV